MRLICTLLLLISSLFLVQAQELEGIVTSSADSLPIEGTHIVNTTASKMAISDEKGVFSLIADKGDTLIVSNVNFDTKKYVVNESNLVRIELNPANIQLDEVRVSNLPENAAEFRDRLVKMGVQEENSFVPFGMKPNEPKSEIPRKYDPKYTNSVGYAINKPISFIVKKVSRKHKNKVKYYKTMASKGTAIANSKKFNAELVKDLTGLEGDKLNDFIQFLDFDAAFIKRSSEYEIAETVLKRFERFKTLHG